MQSCIQKAMIDLKLPMNLDDHDFITIKETVEALKPVKSTVELICRRDTNLIKVDVAICFLLELLFEVVQGVLLKNLVFFGDLLNLETIDLTF